VFFLFLCAKQWQPAVTIVHEKPTKVDIFWLSSKKSMDYRKETMGKKQSQVPKDLLPKIDDDSSALDLDFDFDMSQLEEDFKEYKEKTPPPPANTEKTLRIVNGEPSVKAPQPSSTSPGPKGASTKVSFGSPAPPPSAYEKPDRIVAPSGNPLQQSEHLRIAQKKINSLEEEVESLRREVEAVGSAGETFKKINDEYYSTIEVLKQKLSDLKKTYTQESTLLKKINASKEKQITELKQAKDELKSRLDNNFRNVRNREKDLEHRLEIAKMEEAAVIKSKDQLILDLKRKIDRIQTESENFRQKSQENYRELQDKNQVIRGVSRALRIALTKMDGGVDIDTDDVADVEAFPVEDDDETGS